MNKLLLISVCVGVLLLVGGVLVSAMDVNYFYSPNCPACNSIKSLMSEFYNKFYFYNLNVYDVTQGSYNVQSIPTIRIKTNDCRQIELIGTDEIQKYLNCELQEMTTKGCPTNAFNSERQSWFIE